MSPTIAPRVRPSRRRRAWRWLAVVALAVVAVACTFAWRLMRVDEIPAELPPIVEDPDSITLESLSDAPALVLGEQRGATTFYVLIGPATDHDEGIALNRALNRWTYPDTTRGYIIADAEGAAVFRDVARKWIDFFRPEARFPIYVDFEGAMMRVFGLAKGHHGFVVLGPDGEVLQRVSGGLQGEALDRLREQLGAREPPEPGPAPEFAVGGLDRQACRARACAIVFLGAPVQRSEIPGIEDGFSGDEDEGFALLQRAEVRLAATVVKTDLQGAHGVVVGTMDDVQAPGWTIVDDAPQARAAFGLAPGETAMVIVDEQGRLAFREVGRIAMYKWGLAADVLGAEIMSGDDE